MKRIWAEGIRIRNVVAMSVLLLLAPLTCVLGASAQDPGWPRQITKPSGKLVYYQPQVDAWTNYQTLDARLAFTITPTGGKTHVGVVTVQLQTSVNMDTHTVLLSNPQITSVTFPSLDPATSGQMESLVRAYLNPAATMNISLDRLVATVKKSKTPPTTEVQNTPPTIFISMRPAILLLVNGTPVMGQITNSTVQFVVNANWPLFLDQSNSQYYLFDGKGWMQSSALTGTWTATAKLPSGMSQVPANSNFTSLKQFIPAPTGSTATSPVVYYSATPAEIIVFGGPPQWTAIPGTQLSYGANTGSPVFKYGPTGAYYFLTSGRWFTASGPLGPWTFASYTLPPDFAKIPPSSPQGSILSSVPGTPEAEDAVLIAQIPTTVTVDPAKAASEVKVSYVGEPQFLPITGTSLSYATNTQNRVIQVGSEYYLCYQGIWFVSTSPQGPWQTAQSVPQVIYTIPPSSPVYNVTYVTQVYTDGYVQASYTAGYMGAFVTGAAIGAIVASGTGYYYPPYIYGGYYYPYAASYGYHTYNPYTGAYGYGGAAYGPYGSAHWGASYNPNTGTYARGATASTAYGKQSVGQAYNPYTGAYGATHQGSNAYGSWGQSVVSKNGNTAYTQHASNAYGSAGTVQTSAGGKGAATSTAYGNTAAGKTSNGDMYAGHDGNVYKNTGSGWQTYNNGSWNDVNKPTTTSAQQSAQSYNQQHPTSTSTNPNYASAQQKAQSNPNYSADQQKAQSNPNYSADQQKAQSYSQQHPSGSSSYNKPSSGSYGDMDQEAQNRARGASQSHNYSQQQHSGGGGGWGGGGRSYGGGGGGGFRR
jgi:hypothetical protein